MIGFEDNLSMNSSKGINSLGGSYDNKLPLLYT
jgi:hypothetical protein